MDFKLPNFVYLDTCILVAFYDSHDTGNQHELSTEMLEKINNRIVLCTSNFTFSEFYKALIDKGFDSNTVMRHYTSLFRDRKIGKRYEFIPLEAEGKEKDYSTDDFFVDILQVQVNTRPRPHLADVMHAIVMKNNKSGLVVTFNKDDFKNIEGITAIRPDEIDPYIAEIDREKRMKRIMQIYRTRRR